MGAAEQECGAAGEREALIEPKVGGEVMVVVTR